MKNLHAHLKEDFGGGVCGQVFQVLYWSSYLYMNVPIARPSTVIRHTAALNPVSSISGQEMSLLGGCILAVFPCWLCELTSKGISSLIFGGNTHQEDNATQR